jgi:hypothetical protein
MAWLVSDFDHRDPKDDFHDIDCGRFMDALHNLPGNTRISVQEGDMRIELREIGDRYIVSRVVKKREPEALQGNEHYFVFDKQGRRVRLTEDEYNQLLSIRQNPDDLYNRKDLDLESLNSEHCPPRDVWDMVYNANAYLSITEKLLANDEWQQLPLEVKTQELMSIADGTHPKFVNCGIYSAKWYPYPADKRIHTRRAREIADVIQNRNITRWELMKLIGTKSEDLRMEKYRALKAEAQAMPPGRQRAHKMFCAQQCLSDYLRYNETQLAKNQEIPKSDQRKLWDLWTSKHLQQGGKVKLPAWTFEKMLRAKLTREGVPVEEREQRIKLRLFQHYQRAPMNELPCTRTMREQELPVWLQNAQRTPECTDTDTEDFEFQQSDWLQSDLSRFLESQDEESSASFTSGDLEYNSEEELNFDD